MARPVMDGDPRPSYDFFAMIRLNSRSTTLSGLLLAVLTPVLAAGAQQVRGSVVDSISRHPIVGVVVETLDSAGTALSRGLTDASGSFAIGRAAGVRRLRLVRMGYRPRDVTVPNMAGVEQRIDVAMLVVPTFLGSVSTTVAPNCPRRADSQRAFALLEQARSGLLATIVSRQQNPPALKILNYERTSDGEGQRILHQSVRIDSSNAAATSFSAVRSASRFAQDGFMGDSAGTRFSFGPDADVMLDPDFAAAYCFRVRDGRSATEIGLGFEPARSKRGRVDIEGTLWVDTAAMVVTEIGFNFIGAPRTKDLRPGGLIHFKTMPGGMALIDRWYFRMVDSRIDIATGGTAGEQEHVYYYMRESGGEVAWARWANGQEFHASLATVHLRVVDRFDDKVTRAVVRLTDTDYLGSPDTSGTVVFHDVLPGPYTVELQDSALVSQHIVLKSLTKFIADRGQLIVRKVVSPPTYAFFKQACKLGSTGNWIELVATDDNKKPVQVKWVLGEDLGGRLEHLHATGITARDGVFGYCRDVALLVTLQVHLERLDDPTKVTQVELPSEPGRKPYPVVMPFRVFATWH
ncbi:MAG TPA: carboxypeptidase-like regulatory domain-containing protein [Gemmatimonadaceae bacterium]